MTFTGGYGCPGGRLLPLPTSRPTDTATTTIGCRSGTASATTQRCSQRGRRDSHLSRPLAHRHGLRPGKPARAPLRSKSDGRRRHPGARASRPHAIPLRAAQFPCDAAPGHPAGGTAWARPKQGPGVVAGRAGWRRWPRLCQELCGRDARAPGWASSHDVVAAKEVHRSLCLFVVRLQ